MNSSTADCEESKETAESLHFKNVSVFYYPALFSGRAVYSDNFLNYVLKSLFQKHAVEDLLMHNILYKDRYKCFT